MKHLFYILDIPVNPPTPAQKKVLDAIVTFKQEKGYTPSFRELAKKVGLKSLNTIHFHIKGLEERGYIRCPEDRHRGIELVRESSIQANAVRIPVLGTVPAGAPNLASENYDEFIDVDRSLAKGKVFGLRVRGDSMKDANIVEGDIVVVRLQPAAEDGEIVVARFEDDATVKYLRRRKDGVYLVPANVKYKPIPAKNAQIVGKVTGVIRRY